MRRNIGDKITVSKDEKELIIKIPGSVESWMENALLGWVILWSIMGLYVLYYMMSNNLSNEEQVFFAVYIAFWIYFEYKSVVAYMYKKIGYELIRIDGEFLYYRIVVFGKGKLKRFMLENIRNIHVAKDDAKSFASAYNKSFWVMGNERIIFQHLEKQAAFGMHLSPDEAKEIVQMVRKRIKSK